MLLLSLVLTTSEELCPVCDSLKEILGKHRLGPYSKETCSVRESLPEEEVISQAYLLKVLCYLFCKQHSLVPYFWVLTNVSSNYWFSFVISYLLCLRFQEADTAMNLIRNWHRRLRSLPEYHSEQGQDLNSGLHGQSSCLYSFIIMHVVCRCSHAPAHMWRSDDASQELVFLLQGVWIPSSCCQVSVANALPMQPSYEPKFPIFKYFRKSLREFKRLRLLLTQVNKRMQQSLGVRWNKDGHPGADR